MIDPITWGVVRAQILAWKDEMSLPANAVQAPSVIPPEKLQEFIDEIDKLAE